MRSFKWLLWTGLAWVLAYLSFVEGVDGATNVLLFSVWAFALLTVPASLSGDLVEELAAEGKGFPVPPWVISTEGLAFIAMLVYHGWFLTGIAASIQLVISLGFRMKVTRRMEEMKNAK